MFALSPVLPGPTGIIDGPIGLTSDGLLEDLENILLVDVDIDPIPDDGGLLMTGTATWPTDRAIFAYFIDADSNRIACFSGVIGQEFECWSTDGLTLTWISPPMPVGNYSMEFEASGGFSAIVLSIDVVKRSFTTRLYGLRSTAAPPRQVGPWSIRDEL